MGFTLPFGLRADDIFAGIGSYAQGNANAIANAENIQLRNDIQAGYTTRGDQISSEQQDLMNYLGGNYASTMAEINRTNDALRQGYQGRQAENMGYFDQFAANQSQAYRERLNTAMGYVDQMGTQERADINQDFTSMGNTQQAALAARGMGASTVASGVAGGVERERSSALGRLNDRLLGTRLNAFGAMSGEALNSDAALASARMGYNMSLGADVLNAQSWGDTRAQNYDTNMQNQIGGVMQWGANNRLQNAGDRLNFMQTIQNLPADAGAPWFAMADRISQNRAEERAAKAADSAAQNQMWGQVAQIGGAVLAPFTGGLSLLAAQGVNAGLSSQGPYAGGYAGDSGQGSTGNSGYDADWSLFNSQGGFGM